MKILIDLFSSFLWRVRGGLKIRGKKLPMNKIWFALYVGLLCFLRGKGFECSINATISSFVAYQLNSWGVYIGRLLEGGKIDPETDKENPLVDELILPLYVTIKGQRFYLYQFPKLYGFIGTTITGLMITYLIGLGIGDFWFGFVGAGMGLCYLLGSLLEKIIPLGKGGWNWGEWIFGFYLGVFWGLWI